MSKKALSINFPIERAVLSDFLPYEIPITFSNRHFYNFLIEIGLFSDGNSFYWKFNSDSENQMVLLILGIDLSSDIGKKTLDEEVFSFVDLANNKLPTIPFVFDISHKRDQLRSLALIHPKGQIMAVDFYKKYKDLITYYCNVSPFSLRSAKRVAGCRFIDKKSNLERFDNDDFGIEIDGQNYENLKSFFVYEKYSNIYEFYESTDHHSCETKFDNLSKLDVSSCFDSVYTHSISWAIYQKGYSKKNLNETKLTFASKFDKLMSQINYNETNGILIGPELSRIFAEIVLQSIDIDVFKELKRNGFVNGIDYQLYRYVDDYFIFYNDINVFDKIKRVLSISLKVYKLSLNKHKEEKYSRPIITPISIAKKKISDLISSKLTYLLEKDEVSGDITKARLYFHESSMITEFKSILSVSNVTYSDILNYTLAIVERKVKDILYVYQGLDGEEAYKRQLINALKSIINFSFFIYSVSPKVNGTIKLCRIMQQVIIFLRKDSVGLEYQHVVYNSIFNKVCSILEQKSYEKETPIETLYLLVLLRQLGKNYWLDELTLSKYFDFYVSGCGYKCSKNMNYFSITVLIFYMANKKRYDSLRKSLVLYIKDLYVKRSGNLGGDSEMLHLSLDLIACPFINREDKEWVLDLYDANSNHFSGMISSREFWFTKWNKFDFSKELDAKRSLEVY